MTYTLTQNNGIKLELENGSVIVLPSENNGTPEWRQYQEWLDAGNTPNPYVPPTPIDNLENLEEAQELSNNLIRTTAHSILSPTDWYIVRYTETGKEVPEHITSFRSTIRTETQIKITQVNSQETLENLKDYLRSEDYSTWTNLE
jgi:hypothetical protein